MNNELVEYLRRDIAERQAVNVPAGVGGIPAGAEVHIHYHAAPEQGAAPQPDPAQRSTRDDGVLAWFMPYFVIGLLSFILVGGVVGLIMALAVVLLGALVTFAQGMALALVLALLAAGGAVALAGTGAGKLRGLKGSKSDS